MNLFVGVGGTFNTDNTISTNGATGFFVNNAELHLAFVECDPTIPATVPADTRKWTAIAASADQLTVVGLPSDFEITISDLLVKFNTKAGEGRDCE